MDRTRAFFDRLVAWSPVFLLGGLVQINFQMLAGIVPFRIQATTKLRATSRMS